MKAIISGDFINSFWPLEYTSFPFNVSLCLALCYKLARGYSPVKRSTLPVGIRPFKDWFVCGAPPFICCHQRHPYIKGIPLSLTLHPSVFPLSFKHTVMFLSDWLSIFVITGVSSQFNIDYWVHTCWIKRFFLISWNKLNDKVLECGVIKLNSNYLCEGLLWGWGVSAGSKVFFIK